MPENRQSSRRSVTAPSAVERIADTIRRMSLAAEPGEFLGTEVSLASLFQASAPTLRQAARWLEHEEVLIVKRGVHGGYFAARPNAGTVSRIAATYLHSNLHSVDEVSQLMEALTPLLVDLVLKSDHIDALRPFAAAPPVDQSREQFVEEEAGFSRLLSELSDNAALKLVISIFFDIGVTAIAGSRLDGTNDRELVRQERILLAGALIVGNRDAAIHHALEHRRMIFDGFKAYLPIF